VDKIFTRIGAADSIFEGKSTFLVEMEETAKICSSATKKSLVILDEVGRGTSTVDGLAIARAVVEYIRKKLKAKTIFSTHYHELAKISEGRDGMIVRNFSIKRANSKILFTHFLKSGVAPGSFGIEVARLANLPPELVRMAEFFAKKMKNSNVASSMGNGLIEEKELQNNLFSERSKDSMISRELNEFFSKREIENLSAREALIFIWDLYDRFYKSSR
jgi:DNA mismatch repair protein MutS